ncbi:MAG TPA: hypothetical protein PLJ74_05340 [Myxococcota bacterium]|nr:hypothetical protein [Myxococcota bacterium]
MTHQEIQTAFTRIKELWPRIYATNEVLNEWQKAFNAIAPEQFYKALDFYIQTQKNIPRIPDIYNLLKNIPGAGADSDSSKKYAFNPPLDDKWGYLKMQLAKGLAYCQEPHPQGFIVRWVPIKTTSPDGIVKGRAEKIGTWTHREESADRYTDPYSDLPESSLGRGESWVFGSSIPN